MKTYRFYKTESERWYIDYPEWIEQGGMLEDLEMVSGADEMLDIVAAGETSINLQISTEEFDGASDLIFEKFGNTEFSGGAYYLLVDYDGNPVDMVIWLCDVTRHVFGQFPDNIYFKKA